MTGAYCLARLCMHQEEERARARAEENWDWGAIESGHACPKEFVLLDVEFVYRNGAITLSQAAGDPITELRLGGRFRFHQARGCPLTVIHAV